MGFWVVWRKGAHWFLTLEDAREKMENWLRYYNEVRPHGAIGNKPPISLKTRRRSQPVAVKHDPLPENWTVFG